MIVCRYEDEGRVRPIIHRASLVEMAVPYGDPNAPFQRKCAFDMGDIGLGCCANSLALGCDCLGHIHYFDAVLNDSKGETESTFTTLMLCSMTVMVRLRAWTVAWGWMRR